MRPVMVRSFGSEPPLFYIGLGIGERISNCFVFAESIAGFCINVNARQQRCQKGINNDHCNRQTKHMEGFSVCVCVSMTGAMSAQTITQQSYSLPNGSTAGTLLWNVTYSTGTCGMQGGSSYNIYQYSSFTYNFSYPSSFYSNEQIPVSVSLPGAIGYITNSPGMPYCPNNGPIPNPTINLMDSSQFFRVQFTPTNGGSGTATIQNFTTGGFKPKYLIMYVMYAAPNPGPTSTYGPSSVSYTNTSAVGNSSTIGSSFNNSVSYSATLNLLGSTITETSGWAESFSNSQTVSINKTISSGVTFPGKVPSTVIGLNHDNDLVRIWLNAAFNCMAEPANSTYFSGATLPTAVQCIGFDPLMAPGDLDNPLIDYIDIPVGVLNGDYPLSTLSSGVVSRIQSLGLTTDFPTIAKADPYWQCANNVQCINNVGVDTSRFQLVNAQPESTVTGAAAGILSFSNLGLQIPYALTYTSSTSSSTGSSYSYTVGTTETFGSDPFKLITGKIENQSTWTNSFNTGITSSLGKSAALTLNQPTGSATNPDGTAYTGPTQFKAYQDNVYGTFMFFPTY